MVQLAVFRLWRAYAGLDLERLAERVRERWVA